MQIIKENKLKEPIYSVFDDLMEGCQVIGFDWHYIYLNKAAVIQSRKTLTELSGKIYTDIWPGCEKTELYSLIQNCLEDRVSGQLENEIVNPDGTAGWFDLRIQPVPEGAIVLSIDVTKRKQVEESLRASEQKFHNILINLDEGYYSATLDGTLLEHNQALCRMLGFDSSANLIGLYLPDYWLNSDDRLEYVKALEAADSVSNSHINLKTKTGEKISVLASAHLVKDKDKNPLWIDGIFLDITSRIVAEESIQRQADRLNSLHRIDKAILQSIHSPDEIAQSALRHMRGILQYKTANVGIFDPNLNEVRLFLTDAEGEVIVQSGKKLTREELGDPEILLKGKIEIVEDLSAIESPSGKIPILESESVKAFLNVPLFSAQAFYGILSVGWENPRTFSPDEIEIVEEVASQICLALEQAHLLKETKSYALEMEQRVNERTTQLQAINNELEAFSYSISHDLRAPLRGIHGFTQILMEDYAGKLDTEGKRICSVIKDNSLKMGQLIDDLLAFSRLSHVNLVRTHVNMKMIVNSTFLEVTNAESRSRITLEIGDLMDIQADFAMIQQVWFNLLSNAVKYSSKRDKAMISVTCQREKGKCIYCVKDNGAGFNKDYMNKLFGVFQRLHSTKEFEGTGVVLAIVKRIIHSHGGEVWAEGDVDKGAAFFFSLPIIADKSANL